MTKIAVNKEAGNTLSAADITIGRYSCIHVYQYFKQITTNLAGNEPGMYFCNCDLKSNAICFLFGQS